MKSTSTLRLTGLIFLLLTSVAFAQEWRTENPSAMDLNYRQEQIERLNGIARLELGRSLSGQRDNDIALLQQMLDQRLVNSSDVSLLQAMGIDLGEVLKREKGLEWIIYIDKLGRSRALNVPGTDEFIFPVTQISRRAEVGIKVDVRAVYQQMVDAVDAIRNQPPSLR